MNGQRIRTVIHRKRPEQLTDQLVGVRDMQVKTVRSHFMLLKLVKTKIGQVQVLVRCGAPGAHP